MKESMTIKNSKDLEVYGLVDVKALTSTNP